MMSDDDNDGQMIFGKLGSLKLPDIYLKDEEKPRKSLTQETYPDRGSNPGPLRDRRACCRLDHSGGRIYYIDKGIKLDKKIMYRNEGKNCPLFYVPVNKHLFSLQYCTFQYFILQYIQYL